VWAVGYFEDDTGRHTLAEHWNGSTWSVVPSPSPGTIDNKLKGIAAISSNDVWAVGSYDTSALIEHWNGSVWAVVPNPGSNELTGVAPVSSNNVWAVGDSGGQTLAEHWNGSTWSVIPSPNVGTYHNYFTGVSAVSSSNVWAVGWYYNDTDTVYQTLIEHWDGTIWSIVPSPSPGTPFNNLNGVAAISSNDVWAVGNAYTTLIEHWDGFSWSVVTSPNVGTHSNELYGVTAISSSDMWAVGYYDNGTAFQTLVEHWNGSTWSVVTSPNVGTNENQLNGVAAISSSDVWGVGYYDNGTAFQTLVERYNPCAPPPTATPNTTATPTATPTACSIQYSDVPAGSTFYPYIRCLACRGIINGYPDGSFKPNNQVTRGQLSKIVSNAAGFIDPQTTQLFQDVPAGSTYQVYVGRLASRGYIGGYPCGGVGEPCVPPANLPYFRPNNDATRGQISKIVSNSAGFSDPPGGQQFEDVAVGSAFYTFTFRLVSREVMGGYPCGGIGEPCVPPTNLPYFRPNNNATRGQTSKIVSNTFFPNCQTPQTPQKR
jgi:hypothetical protein